MVSGPTSGSDILDNGRVLTIAGTSSFTTSVSNADITLINSANALTVGGYFEYDRVIHMVTQQSTMEQRKFLTIAQSSVGGDFVIRVARLRDNPRVARITVGGNLTATTDCQSRCDQFLAHWQLQANFDNNGSGNAAIDNGTTAILLLLNRQWVVSFTSATRQVLPTAATVTVGGNDLTSNFDGNYTDANSGVINLGTLAVDGTGCTYTNGSGNATVRQMMQAG